MAKGWGVEDAMYVIRLPVQRFISGCLNGRTYGASYECAPIDELNSGLMKEKGFGILE